MNAAEEKTAAPARYQRARHHIVDDVFDEEFQEAIAKWFTNNARLLEPIGELDRDFVGHFITGLEEHCPLTDAIRSVVLRHVPDALEPCGIEPQPIERLDIHAGVHHHGCAQGWHDERDGDVWLGYAIFLHSMPKRFAGGEVELFDGTMVQPKNNRLLFFDPSQRRRIRRVDCWTAHLLCGRWSIFGWLA